MKFCASEYDVKYGITTSAAPAGETFKVSLDAFAERRIEYSFCVRLRGRITKKDASELIL